MKSQKGQKAPPDFAMLVRKVSHEIKKILAIL